MIYNFILFLLLPVFYLHRYFTHQRAGTASKNSNKKSTQHDIWLHGASVGELNLTLLLAIELISQQPKTKIIITTNTATAMARSSALLKEFAKAYRKPRVTEQKLAKQITFAYAPYDLPFAINKFLDRFSPRLLVTLEAELWRNTSIITRQRQIPSILANARLSPRSLTARTRYKFAMPPAACLPQVIVAQSRTDADNLRKWYAAMGAEPPQLNIFGNMKFDLTSEPLNTLPPNIRKLKKLITTNNKVVWCGASTHHPEEDYLISTLKKLAKAKQDNLLILAPRHPHRFNQVASKLANQRINFIRFSDLLKANFDTNKLKNIKNGGLANCQVLLLDSLGDLPHIYNLASFAFVGGSFTERGGQNILEPLMATAAVILGPKHHNLNEILNCFSGADHGDAYKGTANHNKQYPHYLKLVQSKRQLTQRVSDFISQAAAEQIHNKKYTPPHLAAEASVIITANRGATKGTASLILSSMLSPTA